MTVHLLAVRYVDGNLMTNTVFHVEIVFQAVA